MINFLGYIAAFLTSFGFVFQALRIIKTNDTEAISLKMYVTFVTGVLCWLLYGVLLSAWPIIIANIVTALFAGFILYKKIISLKK